MSSSPDPQTWVFPPLGAAVLPSDPSAAFGPISKGDKIKLQWAPASSTPEIAMICANDGTTFTVSSGANTSPFTYTFQQSINNGTTHMCWMFFPGTTLGNTVTFEYSNQGFGSSTTWQQDTQLEAAMGGGGGATSTVTVTKGSSSTSANGQAQSTVTNIITRTVTPSTFVTTIANPSTTYVTTGFAVLAQSTDGASSEPTVIAQSTGLSAGAAAGIAVAATVVLVLLVLIGFLIFRRIRRDRDGPTSPQNLPPNISAPLAAPAMSQQGHGSYGQGPAPIPADHKYQPPPAHQGYYNPQSFGQDRNLPSVPAQMAGRNNPRGTIHEVEG